jgi:hypothetical protein
MSKQ